MVCPVTRRIVLVAATLLALGAAGCGDPGLPGGPIEAWEEPAVAAGEAQIAVEPELTADPAPTADEPADEPADADEEPRFVPLEPTLPAGGQEPTDEPEEPVEPAEPADPEEPAPADDPTLVACPDPAFDCSGIGGPPLDFGTAHPIVLAHGMLGFVDIGPLEYWFGVPDALADAGYAVYVAEVDALNDSATRASQLAEYVDRVLACTCAAEVNLIGHSQGGLDIRHLVAVEGYADVVASVTTIATPHHGVWLADVGLGLLDGPQGAVIDALSLALGIAWSNIGEDPSATAAIEAVTIQATEAFNAAHPPDPGVDWYSWAGVAGVLGFHHGACAGEEPPPTFGSVVSPLLLASFLLNGGILNPNDGLVPVSSARFGRFRGCVAADHMDEVGQIGGLVDSFDHLAFFVGIADFLVAEGH